MADKRNIIFIMNPISGTTRKSGVSKIIENTLDKEYYDFQLLKPSIEVMHLKYQRRQRTMVWILLLL